MVVCEEPAKGMLKWWAGFYSIHIKHLDISVTQRLHLSREFHRIAHKIQETILTGQSIPTATANPIITSRLVEMQSICLPC